MKVVMVEPGQYARIEELDTGLESLQKAVGGLIDCAYPWQEKVCIVCNDEGLINGMPLNRDVEDYQLIAGPFFVCGIEGEDFCSLTDEQAKRYQEMFLQPELFVGYKDNIMKLKYDDPNLPDAPESAKQAYKERHNLPEYCFCPVPDINLLMLLQYGQSGFWQINIPPVTDLTDYADRVNQRMGVSKAQQTAMMHGFMCEWRGRSMRPELYDENGMPKQNNQRRGEPER